MIKKLKRQILTMAMKGGGGHIPSAYSILDIIWVLYDKILKPEDKFILSKGHGCLALYVVLTEKRMIPPEYLENFSSFNSPLGGHPDRNKVPWVEASTGSLGHGLPMAVGKAMALKIKNLPGMVYCLVGDGECNEGSIWEALMIASHHKLTNLVCIVDYNRSTDRALRLDDLARKFMAFGFGVLQNNGHDQKMLKHLFETPYVDRPTVVICETIKGNGVKRMENNPAWHHRKPTKEEYDEIITEL